jgi:hypothetical protein
LEGIRAYLNNLVDYVHDDLKRTSTFSSGQSERKVKNSATVVTRIQNFTHLSN